ncbi:MAG: hypothetical protein SFW62_07690 [Alphaproteobacteria bacterium]|nr:hypothetical protein [Alphaproteobacteria bacterium]
MKKILFNPVSASQQGIALNTRAALALMLTLALLWPDAAFAQAVTLGKTFCNLYDNLNPFSKFFSIIAYVAGGFFVGNGLYKLVQYADNPSREPLHAALARIAGGSALLAAPSVVGTLINTLFTTQVGGGLRTCNPGGVAAASDVALDTLVKNLVGNIKDPLTILMSVTAFTIGLFFIIRGLMKASKYGMDPRTHSVTNILANLLIGTVLVTVGQSLGAMLSTVFGNSAVQESVVDWAFVDDIGGDTARFKEAVKYALIFFQLIGMIAFIRGWLIVKSAVEGNGQATIAQGITHIIGGVLAINIFYFLKVMDVTFGTGFL